MFTALEFHALAFVDENAVIELPPMTDDVPPEHRIPHPQEDLVHPERVVLRDLLCRVEADAGKGLHHVPLEQDVVRLLAIVEPALDPEVVHEIRLDLVDRAVVLAREGPVTALHRAALDNTGAGRDMDDGTPYCRLSATDRDVRILL